MKVLHINSVAAFGSTATIAEDLCRGLEARGGRAVLAYGRGDASDKASCIRIGSPLSVLAHGAASRISDRHGRYSLAATAAFLRRAEAFRPDLVHLHNLHGYYLNYPMLFAWLRDKKLPVVWTLHDCWAFTGHCAHFIPSGCEKWRSGCGACGQKGSYPKSLLADASSRNHADKRRCFTGLDTLTVVTPSEWLKSLAGQSFLGAYPIRCIHNGVDLGLFRPDGPEYPPLSHKEDRILLLGVAGSWAENKGLEDFFRLRQLLDARYRIALVGLSPAQLASLPEGVEGFGRIRSAEELAAIYRSADLFLNPSYADTYPSTQLEALASGTPVLCYDTGGCAEALADRRCVVPRGDVVALAGAIRAEAWRDCVFPARDRLDKQRAIAEYLSLYESL